MLSQEEVARLIDATGNLMHRAMVMTLYATGVRRAELCGLKVADIDSERMILHIQQGKGGRDRDVPLGHVLLQKLNRTETGRLLQAVTGTSALNLSRLRASASSTTGLEIGEVMSWSEHCVQDHRRQTDSAIHRACSHLAFDPLTLTKFHELLICARRRAPRLFEAPVVDGRHPGVEALFHLARFRDAHIRSATDWAGISSSWCPAVSSLAQHLICRYRVPTFMSSVWHAGDAAGDRKRSWVIAHSRGASFRSLNLPIAMTRKMERIFLGSHDHLALESALRKAELLALGVPAEFIKSIMLTRLATDLRNGDFWRTFWMFLVPHAGEIDPGQIGPMIDYIQSVRHNRIGIETQDGVLEVFPPQPAFSMKGRTVPSVLRLMREWHRHLGDHGGPSFSWARSSFKPWLFEEPRQDDAETPRRWHMMELTNSAQLRQEGVALHHCVGSYGHLCHRGSSSIWSLRVWQGEKIRSVLTVEIDPKRRAVIQARGRANRSPSGKSLKFLHHWVTREGLQMAI